MAKDSHPLQIKKIEPKVVSMINVAEQMQLDIKHKKSSWFQKTKTRLTRDEMLLEKTPYGKTFLTSLTTLSAILFIGIMIYLTINYYAEISNSFPLFYSQATESWHMYDKEVIPMFVIILSSMLLIILKLNHSTHFFDRRLSTMINISIVVFNLLGIFAFSEILSLILIY